MTPKRKPDEPSKAQQPHKCVTLPTGDRKHPPADASCELLGRDSAGETSAAALLVGQLLAATFGGEFDTALRCHRRRWAERMEFDDYRQKVFDRVFQHVTEFNGQTRGQWVAWLRQIGRGLGADEERQRQRRKESEREWLSAHDSFVRTTGKAAEVVEELVGELSREEAHVVRLRHLEGLRMHQVAALLGITVDAAQKRVARAMERLNAVAWRK